MPKTHAMLDAPGDVPDWTLSDRLRKAREHAHADQDDLARMIGLTRATVSNYERGVTKPRRPSILAWALACGVSLQWLLEGTIQDASLSMSGSFAQSTELQPLDPEECAARDSNPEPAATELLSPDGGVDPRPGWAEAAKLLITPAAVTPLRRPRLATVTRLDAA